MKYKFTESEWQAMYRQTPTGRALSASAFLAACDRKKATMKKYLVEQVWLYSFAVHTKEIGQFDDLDEAKAAAAATPRLLTVEHQKVEVVDNETDKVLAKF